jgi:hypothetical protein
MAESKQEIDEFQLALIVGALSLGRLGSAIDVVLIGTALGTVLDFKMGSHPLWGVDSEVVTNALLPMFASVGFMAALALSDLFITVFLNDHVAQHVKFEVRPDIRRVLLLLLRLAYHAFLICAGAAIALWTQVYFWHGHRWIWAFGLLAVFAANGFSEVARKVFQLDGRRRVPREVHKWSLHEIGLIFLIAAGIIVSIVRILSSQHPPG